MGQSRYLRIPRPIRFLGVMSLSTGVEMIILSMIFNKLTGFYGLLAVLTGLHLTPLQLSMYIYSCVALVFLAFLIPHVRRQSPFQCIVLAYFYLIDTLVNIGFTCAFAMIWILAVSTDDGNSKMIPHHVGSNKATAASNLNYNDSGADGGILPVTGIVTAQKSVSYDVASAMRNGFEELVPSIALVAALTLVRIYFVFVIMAFAQQVLKQSTITGNATKPHIHTDGCLDTVPEGSPFEIGQPAGEGWRGKLGRILLRIGEDYWLAEPTGDEMWARGFDGRFRSSKVVPGPPGTIERERRARSGTGPPVPPPNIKL